VCLLLDIFRPFSNLQIRSQVRAVFWEQVTIAFQYDADNTHFDGSFWERNLLLSSVF
jgi:hypothetical protein